MSAADRSSDEQGTERERLNTLEDVLDIERQARAIIADADDKALRIVADARGEALELERRARRSAEIVAAGAVADALRRDEEDTRALANRVEREMERWEAGARRRLTAVVDRVVRAITLEG